MPNRKTEGIISHDYIDLKDEKYIQRLRRLNRIKVKNLE